MLDHVIGYNTTKDLYATSKTVKIVSPYSNQPVACVMTFGSGAQFDKATNFVLAHCFFGDKLVGTGEI